MYSQSANRQAVRVLTIAGALLGAVLAGAGSSQAVSFRVIYNFCTSFGCADGSNPQSGLALDAAGNLYGVTYGGGINGGGTVFELSPKNPGWKYDRLYSFCKQRCHDGRRPNGPLIIDTNGNLYGTTQIGGEEDEGSAFEMMPNGDRTKWSIQLLHSFLIGDGNLPQAGLTYQGAASGAPYDGASPLYGTTYDGGAHNGGTAFSLTPGGGNWNEAVIYNFCTQGACADGIYPQGELIADAFGNLYGTTVGSADGHGTAFRLAYESGKWSETVLYDFCRLKYCKDGTIPMAALVADASGNLLGTTTAGGDRRRGCCGTIFSLAPAGGLATLYDFCSDRRCGDGVGPHGALTLDSAGIAYGSTVNGGNYDGEDSNGGGVIFALAGNSLQILHRFCFGASCGDGRHPYGGLAMDASGNLFGTTQSGGKFNGGTVFELSP